MRLTVATAVVVNLVTALLLAGGLTASVAACVGAGCANAAVLSLVGLSGLAVGSLVWWRGDPLPLLVVDLAILGVIWIVDATGLVALPELWKAIVPFAGSIWMAVGAFALGRLWLSRTAPAAATAGPVTPLRSSTLPAWTPAAPGEARFAALMEALDRMPADGVRMLVVTPLDPAAHESARGHASARAAEAGRAPAIADARKTVEAWVRRWLSDGAYDPTFVAIAWRHEPLGPEERMRLIETLEDAALGLIVADLVDETISDELLGPCAVLVDPAAAGG